MSDANPSADQDVLDDNGAGRPIEENLRSKAIWLRLLFMIIFCFVISIASIVGTAVIVLGFFWVLFTGETNRQLAQTGQSLASYFYEIVRYLTFNTDEKPFPFGRDWPSPKSSDSD